MIAAFIRLAWFGNKKVKQKIIRYFNQGAATYDTSAEVQTYVAKQLALRIQPITPQKILEIGCGTGLLSEHLTALFPGTEVLLTDIAPTMVQICRERFRHLSHIKTDCVDAESAAHFVDAQFDLITSSMTLHWFESFSGSLQKLIDALAPGGSIHFAMLGKGSLCEWQAMCESLGLNVATPVFPEMRLIENDFPDVKFEREIYQQRYKNAYAFLNSLKCLGARASHPHHIPVSSGKLRQLFRRYTHEISMSYEIIYGSYTKL